MKVLSHTTVRSWDQMPSYATPHSIIIGKNLKTSSSKESQEKSDPKPKPKSNPKK